MLLIRLVQVDSLSSVIGGALGVVFGVMSMAAVAVLAMLVTWITVLVLLAFCGKRWRDLVVEAKKLTAEISGVVARILIKEENFVVAVCAVLGKKLRVLAFEFEHTPPRREKD